MKKSEMIRMAQLAVIAHGDMTDSEKVETVLLLEEKRSVCLYDEREAEKKAAEVKADEVKADEEKECEANV